MFKITGVALLLIAAIALWLNPSLGAQQQTTSLDPNLIKRGEYLAVIGGCHDCHTPKKYTEKGEPLPDMTKVFMGHPSNEKIAEIPRGILSPEKWMVMGNANFTAWAGPWGVSYSANLTPDNETGIGTWTEEMFIKAMRTGKHLGEGRPILPPMPWANVAQGTDADLKALFAYMKSLKPIQNAVPDPMPPPSN